MRSAPHKKRETGAFAEVWRHCNELNEFVRETAPLQSGSMGVKIVRTSNGTLFKVDPRELAEAASARRFTISAIQNDYLTCSKVNPDGTTISDSATNIAKTQWLRVSYFNNRTSGNWTYSLGASNTRRAVYSGSNVTGGLQVGDYQDQELDPPYVVGEEIYAIEAEGETGVQVSGVRLTWIEITPRQFRAIRTLVEVCRTENGQKVNRRIVLEGGPVF